MDYHALYELSDKPAPEPRPDTQAANMRDIPHDPATLGDTRKSRNMMKTQHISTDSPMYPPVPCNFEKVRIKPGAPVVGAERNPCADFEQCGRDYIGRAASELNHPAADLLDWYAPDLAELGAMAWPDALKTIGEYLRLREWYRNKAASPTR